MHRKASQFLGTNKNLAAFVETHPRLASYKEKGKATYEQLTNLLANKPDFRHILLDSYTIRMGIFSGKITIDELFNDYDIKKKPADNIAVAEKKINETLEQKAVTNPPKKP